MRKALLLVAIAACSKKEPTDDCEKFVERSMPILAEQIKQSPKPVSLDDAKVKFLESCKQGHGKPGNKDEALLTCVNAADGEAAIKACWDTGFKSYAHDSRAVEGKLQLRRLQRELKVAWVDKGAYPIGKAGPTPTVACCASPDHKCPATDAWGKDPVWTALSFQIAEPTQFQYSYESDGKTAKLTAVGDPECAGKPVTYQVDLGTAGVGTIAEH